MAQGEHIGIITRATAERVIALAPHQQVIARRAGNHIPATAPVYGGDIPKLGGTEIQGVAAADTQQQIAAVTAVDDLDTVRRAQLGKPEAVVPGTAGDHIKTRAADNTIPALVPAFDNKEIVAARTVHGVIAQPSGNHIVPVGSQQVVVPVRPHQLGGGLSQQAFQHCLHVDGAAVGEAQGGNGKPGKARQHIGMRQRIRPRPLIPQHRVQLAGIGHWRLFPVAEKTGQANTTGTVRQRDRQLILLARKAQVAQRYTGAKGQPVLAVWLQAGAGGVVVEHKAIGMDG